MLRPNLTQIKLEKKDLEWHGSRHIERQKSRTAALTKDEVPGTRKETPRRLRLERLPDDSPRSRRPFSSMHTGIRRTPDAEIFSDDAVPLRSRAFWDRILAEAGTPTRVQSASVATATVIQPSDEFLNSTHSSRGSIASVSVDEHDRSENLSSPSFEGAIDSSSYATPYPSESSDSARDREPNAEKTEQQLPPREVTQSTSSKTRISFFPFRRKGRSSLLRSSDSVENGPFDHSLSGSMAVDGPSDRYSTSYRNNSSGDPPSLHDDEFNSNRIEQRTMSQLQSRYDEQVRCQDTEASSSRLATPTSLPPPRALGHSRNFSASMPRSSLYISETLASSSPEKRPRTPTDRRPTRPQIIGLLSQPARRPRMYRQRSQTYSFTKSEASPNGDVPQMDGSSTIQTITDDIPSLHISEPLSPVDGSSGMQQTRFHTPSSIGYSSDFYLPSSPPEIPSTDSPHGTQRAGLPQDVIEIRSYHSRSSMLSSNGRTSSSNSQVTSSPNYRNNLQPTLPTRSLSPLATPFIPRSPQRNMSSPLILPPPFSATARTVSSTNAYPPSSPASPHTPPPPTRQPSISLSPPTSRIPIYNDNLDPATQPQTPVGLPRHGIPAMHTQNAGAYTMPTRGLGRFSSRAAMAEWAAFATPTRRRGGRGRGGRGVGDVDQENVLVVTEEERRGRREREV